MAGFAASFGDHPPMDGKTPISGLMHKVQFHREGLAIDQVFAGCVKVKLQEFEIRPTDPKKIINPAVHHKRMAVVCHRSRHRGVVDIKVRQIGIDVGDEVGRRLKADPAAQAAKSSDRSAQRSGPCSPSYRTSPPHAPQAAQSSSITDNRAARQGRHGQSYGSSMACGQTAAVGVNIRLSAVRVSQNYSP